MRLTALTAAGTLLLAGAVAVHAHGGATGIVKERMEAMEEMGDVMKSLTAIMRGETDYDADAVRKGAAVIGSHAGEALTKLFPKDSLSEASEAKPDIWADWESFSALASQLELFANGLGDAAENGLAHGSNGPGFGGGMMGWGGMTGQGGRMGQGGMMAPGTMMGQGGMMGGFAGSGMPMADPDMLAQMPADGLFNMVAQTCSSCHSAFRTEKE